MRKPTIGYYSGERGRHRSVNDWRELPLSYCNHGITRAQQHHLAYGRNLTNDDLHRVPL